MIIQGESCAPKYWQFTVKDLLGLSFLPVCLHRNCLCKKRASKYQIGESAEALNHVAEVPEIVPKAATWLRMTVTFWGADI